MAPLAPSFLLPSVLTGTFMTLAALIFAVNHALKAANWSARDRSRTVWSGTILLMAFFLAALVPARLGFYQPTSSPIPTIQFGLLTPILLGILLFFKWPPFRRVLNLIPQQWLVGLQLYRVEGAVFLSLYALGVLPAAFALPAGIGDVLIGLAAPLVAIAYARNWRHADALVRTWNLLGIMDLVIATATGFLTSPSPLQLLARDAPNQLISRFPLVMVPVFLVPIAILLHLASLQRLRRPHPVPHTTQHAVVADPRG